MFKELSDAYKDKENRGIVADVVKTIGIVMLIFDIRAIVAWAKTQIRLLYNNKKLIEFLQGTKSFFTTTVWHLVVLVALLVACWVAAIAVLTVMNAVPGNQTKAVVLVVGGLTVTFLIGCLMVFEAVKLHAALELISAAKSVLGAMGNNIKHLLPSYLQFDWGAQNTGKLDGLLQSFRVTYKVIFWVGVLNIAMAVIVCLTFGVFYGAILAAIVLNFALVGLGLKIGYNITSDTARIWAFRFVIVTVATGLAIVMIGPKNIAHWMKSKSVVTMKKDVTYNQRKADLEEANKLAVTIRNIEASGGSAKLEHEVYGWLLSDKANKGPRPTAPVPVIPTCSDKKDNNSNNMIDEDDPSCYGPVDKSVCVERIDNKDRLKSDCRKQTVTGKDGNRVAQYFRYNPNLNERDMPKVEKPAAVIVHRPPPSPPPAPVATNNTRMGNAERIVLERMRAGKYRSGR